MGIRGFGLDIQRLSKQPSLTNLSEIIDVTDVRSSTFIPISIKNGV